MRPYSSHTLVVFSFSTRKLKTCLGETQAQQVLGLRLVGKLLYEPSLGCVIIAWVTYFFTPVNEQLLSFCPSVVVVAIWQRR
jgi:flagellar biosynthesis protein FliQ